MKFNFDKYSLGFGAGGLAVALLGGIIIKDVAEDIISRRNEIEEIRNRPVPAESREYRQKFDDAEESFYRIAGNIRYRRENPERFDLLERKMNEAGEAWRQYNRDNRKELIAGNMEIEKVKEKYSILNILSALSIGGILACSGLASMGAGFASALGRQERPYTIKDRSEEQ